MLRGSISGLRIRQRMVSPVLTGPRSLRRIILTMRRPLVTITAEILGVKRIESFVISIKLILGSVLSEHAVSIPRTCGGFDVF